MKMVHELKFFTRDGQEYPAAREYIQKMSAVRSEHDKSLQSRAGTEVERAKLARQIAGSEWFERKVSKGRKVHPAGGRLAGLNEYVVGPGFRFSDYLDDEHRTLHTRDREESGDGRRWPVQIDLSSFGYYSEFQYRSTGSGAICKIETYQDAGTRKLGAYVDGANFTPDDDDVLFGFGEGGLWWNYTPETDCRLRVRALLKSTYVRSFRTTMDEWLQVSNCAIKQHNYVTIGYFADGFAAYGKQYLEPRLTAGDYYGDGSGRAPERDILIRNGNDIFDVSATLNEHVQKGRQMTCFIGGRSMIDAWLDDVFVSLRQGGSWHVISLTVEELPL